MFFCASMFPGTGLFLPHLFTIRLSFPLVSAGGEVVNHSVSEWSFAFQSVPHLLSLACSEFSPHSVSFHLVLVLLHCASSVLLSLKSLKPHSEVMIYYTPLSQVWLSMGSRDVWVEGSLGFLSDPQSSYQCTSGLSLCSFLRKQLTVFITFIFILKLNQSSQIMWFLSLNFAHWLQLLKRKT